MKIRYLLLVISLLGNIFINSSDFRIININTGDESPLYRVKDHEDEIYVEIIIETEFDKKFTSLPLYKLRNFDGSFKKEQDLIKLTPEVIGILGSSLSFLPEIYRKFKIDEKLVRHENNVVELNTASLVTLESTTSCSCIIS